LSFKITIERNGRYVSRFQVHNRTGRISTRYVQDHENEVLYGSVSEKTLEEARYNLATHVMSNGVELIIASEKGKPMEKVVADTQKCRNNISRLIKQQYDKPSTLAPSTLKNQMILTLPSIEQVRFIYNLLANLKSALIHSVGHTFNS